MKYSPVLLRSIIMSVLVLMTNDSGICQYIINGKIKETENVQGYNVLLISKTDSSILEGKFFIADTFEFETTHKSGLLGIRSMGFRDTVIGYSILPEKKNLNILIKLQPESRSIDEVVIRQSIPVIRIENNKLIVTIENTFLSKTGNAADVLSKTINVKIDELNNVSVVGKGKAIVYVDNRELKTNHLLTMISSEEIKKIEIINNPGADYNAEAKAVVNIITKKDGKLGFGANLNISSGYNVYPRGEINLALTKRTIQNSFYSFYAYKPQKLHSAENYKRDYTKIPSSMFIENNMINTTYFTGHRFKIADNYNTGKNHHIELQADLNLTNKYQKIDNQYMIAYPGSTIEKGNYTSIINSDIGRNLSSINIAYEYLKPNNGLNISIASDYLFYKCINSDTVIQLNETNNETVINNSDDRLSIYSFCSDLIFPVTATNQVKLGSKYVRTSNLSNTEFDSIQYNYGFQESITSIYGTFHLKKDKTNLNIGTRMEYAVKAYNHKLNEINRVFFFFPSLNFTYNLTTNLSGSLSFKRSIIRPTYKQINSTRHYTDSLSYSQGNPFLKPELSNTADLAFQYMEYASINLNYSKINNSIIVFAENDIDNQSVTKLTYRNISEQNSISINAVVPYQFPWLTLYVAFGYVYNTYSDISISKNPIIQSQSYIQTGYNFKLPYNMNFDITFQYISSGVLGIWRYKSVYFLDLSLQKSFFNDKLILTIIYDDVLNSGGLETIAEYHNKIFTYHDYGKQTFINFTISYRFNSLKSKFKRNNSIDTERNRIE